MKAGAPLLFLCGLSCLTPPPVPPYREPPIKVAITIDALPAHGPTAGGTDRVQIATSMLQVLARHRVPRVVGFIDTATVGADLPHGNDGEALPRPIEPLADILRPEPVPNSLKVFRHPFPVSIDANDWAFDAPIARCTERALTRKREWLIESFVAHHVHELEVMEMILYRLEARSVPQILLLHVGVASAAALEALLTAYEARGVQWIGLSEALADPFYRLDPGTPARHGAAHPYRIAKQRGVRAPKPVFAAELQAQLDAICR